MSSTLMVPWLSSCRRKRQFMIVDFPAPVRPTTVDVNSDHQSTAPRSKGEKATRTSNLLSSTDFKVEALENVGQSRSVGHENTAGRKEAHQCRALSVHRLKGRSTYLSNEMRP